MTQAEHRRLIAAHIRKIGGSVSLLCSTVLCLSVYAQQGANNVNTFAKDTAGLADVVNRDTTHSGVRKIESNPSDQRDIYDVLKMLLNIDITPSDTVSKEKGKLYVAALPAAGYSLNTETAITIGANAGIYTDDVDSVNLSTFNFNPTYTTKRQILLPFQSNVWTPGNEYDILGNWIYYKYPELTYGLGGHTVTSDAEQLDYQVHPLSGNGFKKAKFGHVRRRRICPRFPLEYHGRRASGGKNIRLPTVRGIIEINFLRIYDQLIGTTADKTRSIRRRDIMPLSSTATTPRSSGATETGNP